MITVGVGCRKDCPAEDIAALVRLSAESAGLALEDLSSLCAPAFKHAETGLVEAARLLGLPLVLVPESLMKSAEDRILTRSEKVIALTGLASVAETAALAGAGPRSRLVQARMASRNVTCAIAVS